MPDSQNTIEKVFNSTIVVLRQQRETALDQVVQQIVRNKELSSIVENQATEINNLKIALEDKDKLVNALNAVVLSLTKKEENTTAFQ